MSDSKMREEFETWGITCAWLGLSDECMERAEDGYVGLELHAAWLAWQASRAAVVVGLPKSSNARNTEVIKAVGRHIIRQGLKVNP